MDVAYAVAHKAIIDDYFVLKLQKNGRLNIHSAVLEMQAQILTLSHAWADEPIEMLPYCPLTLW